MPKHSKDTDSDTSDSGPERTPPPSKKAKTSSGAIAKTDDDGNTYFDVDGYKRVSVREFKGKIYVDIREFYEKDGKVLPGKKGISLNVSQWNKIKQLSDDIDSAVAQIR